MCVYICSSIYLSIYLFIYLSIYLSIYRVTRGDVLSLLSRAPMLASLLTPRYSHLPPLVLPMPVSPPPCICSVVKRNCGSILSLGIPSPTQTRPRTSADHFIFVYVYRWEIGLYKIRVYFKAFVHERIIPFLPLPICSAHTIARLLHDYCAIYDPSLTPLLYAIHHTKLV